jgi:hypothetical protein
MYFLYNDFVSAKHGLHDLKCDFVLKFNQFDYRTKFEHFMHGASLIMHNHNIPSSFSTNIRCQNPM